MPSDFASPAFVIEDGDVLGDGVVPNCNPSDPAQIEALFGNFGLFDHWRKVVLSNCEEIVRARYTLKGEKITESRINSLARLHPNYIELLTQGLLGRTERERNVHEAASGGYGR